jgi:outer membrane lipoprotein SlyB
MDRDTTEHDDTHTTRDGEKHATTGGSAAAGAVTGGVVGGMAGGPVGAAVGAVGGAILGAAGERVMHGRPGHEHIEGDEAHYANDHEHVGDTCTHDHRFH